MATLNIEKTKRNLVAAIEKYRGLKTVQANNDERDNAVKAAIGTASSWLQVGVLGTQLSGRFGLLQNPIGDIHANEEALKMRFNEGTAGSYISRGTTPDNALAFVLNITRIPTTGMCNATNTYFSLSGFVLDGGKVKAFSPPGIPIFCTGTYFSSEVPEKISLVMNLSESTSNAISAGMHLKSAAVVITGAYKNVKTSIGFNDGTVYVFDLHGQYDVALQAKDGCVACQDGTGTNYASYTYESGTGVVFTGNIGPGGKAASPSIPPANVGPGGKHLPEVEMAGWFDHHWGNETPKSFLGSALRSFENTVHTPRSYSHIWIGLQVSSTLQYVVLLQTPRPSGSQRMQQGDLYAVTVNRFDDGVATYDLPKCTVTITSMMQEDAYIPASILVSIPGDGGYTVKPVCDGRVTGYDGSIDLQGILRVYDVAQVTRKGVGYIFGTGLHVQSDDVRHTMRLASLYGPITPFMPHKIHGKAAAAPIALISGLSAVGVLVLAGIIFGLVFAFRPSPPRN